MRVFLHALLLLCFATSAVAEPPPRPLPWTKLNELYFTTSQVRLYGTGDDLSRDCLTDSGGDNALCNAIYMLKYPPTWPDGSPRKSYGPQTPNTPIITDLRPLLGPPECCDDAKFALLVGMLLMTPTCCGTSEVTVTFARPEDPIDCSPTGIMGQALNDVRSNATFPVPLTEGRVKWCYSMPQGAAGTSYGLNFSVIMWGR
jgi:hypothetical protein